MHAMPRRRPDDVEEAINEIVDEVEQVLSECRTDEYFESLLLLYSLLENTLKWMVFVQLLWNQAGERSAVDQDQVDELSDYAGRLRFSDAIDTAHAVGAIDIDLKGRLNAIREERNDILHEFWLYEHRGDGRVLRQKLEKVARATHDLLNSIEHMAQSVGARKIFKVYPE